MAVAATVTLKQAEQLKAKGHVVAIYPRKKQVVVDGFQYYKLTGQTKKKARRKKPKSNPAWPQRWVLRLTRQGKVWWYQGGEKFSDQVHEAVEFATFTSAIAVSNDLRHRFRMPMRDKLEAIKATLLPNRQDNPSKNRQVGRWIICALGPLKERLYYTGRGFGQWTRDPKQAHWLIGREMANYVAYRLQAVDPVVAGWKVTVRRMFRSMKGGQNPVTPANPVPPSSKARLKEAARRYEDFTGHAPEHIDVLDVPDTDTAFGIGDCDGVLYSCVRDGKSEHYIHKFKKSARPFLASSFDGQQLLILGGGFQFTDRGIVDD